MHVAGFVFCLSQKLWVFFDFGQMLRCLGSGNVCCKELEIETKHFPPQSVKHVLPGDKHIVTVLYNHALAAPLPPHRGNVFGKYWQQCVACEQKQ